MVFVMAPIPNTGRLAAHTLIDALSAHDTNVSQERSDAAVQLALQRLKDIGAVEVTYDQATESVAVNISHVVSPAIIAMLWLATRLSEATGVSEEEIYAEMREYFDEA